MRPLKIPYALNAQGKIVHATDATGGIEYTCPGCPRPIRRRRGDWRRKTHFYHPAGADHCSLHNRETYYHIMGKLALQHLLTQKIGQGDVSTKAKVRCFVCGHHTETRLNIPAFEAVLVEERAAGSLRVPDLVLRHGGKDVAYIEVKYRQAVGAAKARELAVPWIEIDAEDLVERGTLVVLNGVTRRGQLALTNFTFCANPDCWVIAAGADNEGRPFQETTSLVRLDAPIILPLKEAWPQHHTPGKTEYGLFSPRGSGYQLQWPNEQLQIPPIPTSLWGCDVDYFPAPSFNGMHVQFPDGTVKGLNGRTGEWSTAAPKAGERVPGRSKLFTVGWVPLRPSTPRRSSTARYNTRPWPPALPDDPPPRRHKLGKLPPTEDSIRWVQCLADTGHLERPPIGPGIRATTREEALQIIRTHELPTRRQYRDDHAWWSYRRRMLDAQRAAAAAARGAETATPGEGKLSAVLGRR